MGSQSDTTERLNWTELNCFYISLDLPCEYCGLSVKMEICSLYYFVHGFSSSLWHLCDSVTLLYVAVIHSSFLLPSIPIYYSLNSHSTWDGHLGYSQFIHVLCNVCVWVSELLGHRHVLSLNFVDNAEVFPRCVTSHFPSLQTLDSVHLFSFRYLDR